MNRADQGALAWALADSATVYLKPAARAWLCAKIGAGEHESAIRDLLVFYANADEELPCQLAAPVRAWIHGYAGTDTESVLRHIYERINISAATQQSQTEPHHSPHRLIAKRSERATRTAATRRPTHTIQRVRICGITTSIED